MGEREEKRERDRAGAGERGKEKEEREGDEGCRTRQASQGEAEFPGLCPAEKEVPCE